MPSTKFFIYRFALGTIALLFLQQTLFLWNIDRGNFDDEVTILPHFDTTNQPSVLPTSKTKFNWDKSVCQTLPGEGPEGIMGYQALIKIKLSKLKNNKPLKVLCIIHTHSNRHATVAKVAYETYGQKCDGFLAASNATDPDIQAIRIFKGHENTWLQVHSIWKYVHDHYRDAFDYFHFGPDTMYVVPENLRYSMTTHHRRTRTPKYVGGAMVSSHDNRTYCGGRSGYTFNLAALTLFVNECSKKKGSYNDAVVTSPNILDIDIASELVARCFRRLSIECTDPMDKSGAKKYQQLAAQDFADKNVAYMETSRKELLKKMHNVQTSRGMKAVSESTIAMSLATEASVEECMRRYYAILYGLCEDVWERPLGALDADGNPGYIHDPTYLRRHPLPFQFYPPDDRDGVCQLPLGQGAEGPSGSKGLQKIVVNNDLPIGVERKRIMCVVFTHSGAHDVLRAIAETFGPRCDGFMAASNLTDPVIGAVHILHEGPETYMNLWNKVRAMWRYIHDNYIDQFDFFHMAGDDTFVIPENLRWLVSTGSWKGTWNHSQPLYLGGPMVASPKIRQSFCGGPAGYTLNRVAVRLLVEELFTKQGCWPHFPRGYEDRKIGGCFRSAGIKCIDTSDKKNQTRYHNLDAEYSSGWNRSVPHLVVWRELERFHGVATREGLNQISESSISFHLKIHRDKFGFRGIRRYFAILYGLCVANNTDSYSEVRVQEHNEN